MVEYYLKTGEQIKRIKEAGDILHRLFEQLSTFIVPGLKTIEIEKFAEDFIRKNGAVPEFMNVPGYRHATCISINEEVVHGIPSSKKSVKEGDIVKVDAGAKLNGFIADSCVTFPVGKITKRSQQLIDVTKEALALGIEQARVGNTLGDIGNAIQKHVEKNSYSVVRDFVGHGVGLQLHEPPQILHYGKAGTGIKLIEGMVLAIEPMVNEGTWRVKVLKDGWTAITLDQKLSAQFEHTVAITANGPEILT
ncbi:type I methionyl aminopeptidase [bacterium]|nr:type I methionyl aminopeptidase [bacterium]